MYYGLAFGVITLIILNYALWGRCWLKERPWAHGFFAWIESFEIALYKKSETILWARWRQLMGYLLALLGFIGQIDYTQIAQFLPFVPEKFQWIGALLPLVISISGHIAEFFRNRSTLPVEVVALPDSAPAPLKDAAEAVVLVKEEAVAAIKEAKAEGKV